MALPKNPAQIIQVAQRLNGFNSPGMEPWHLKATFATFDDQGSPSEQGTFEEWWAAPDRYKTSFVSPSFTQTDYVTSQGRYRSGAQTDLPFALSVLRARLLAPIPIQPETLGQTLGRHEQTFGKAKLVCVELESNIQNSSTAPFGLFPSWCFEPHKPVLRVSGSFGRTIAIYQQVGTLNGRYIAEDLRISDWGKPLVEVKLATAGLLTSINPGDFDPPPGTPKYSIWAAVDLPSKVVAGRRIAGDMPEYPAEAKEHRQEGQVVLDAIIGTDGRIHELTVAQAPDPTLAIAALRAVSTWRYTPYLSNGVPVQVHTEINVIYKLGR